MSIPKEEEDIENLLNNSSAWTTTYGDLMSSLMIIFLCLFVCYFVAKNNVNMFPDAKPLPEVSNPSLGVNVALKEKVFFPYRKDNTGDGVRYALNSIEKNIDGTKVILVDETVNTDRTSDGLYNSNWVSKVVLVVEQDKTGNKYYIVKNGDNLWNLSKKYLGNPWRYPELAKMSGISNPSLIRKGNLVTVPQAKKPVAKAPKKK